MNRRSLRMALLGLMFLLVLVYFRLWTMVSSSSTSVESSSSSPPRKKKTEVLDTPPLLSMSNQQSKIMMIGKTKIVAFCNFNYRSVGVTWYKRMTRLGYESHVIVATDLQMVQFLQTRTDFRYEVMVHEPMPDSYRAKPMPKQDHAVLELLMAVRWKFLLQQLEQGVHVLLTDIDNIFTRYIDIDTVIANHHYHDDQDASMDVDVWHAYATKYPRKSFAQQGFVVCSGMSWWRASPAAIRFGRLMHDTCGSLCDDQRILNNLLAGPKLNMTWDWTPTIQASRLTNATTQDPRFVGLPALGISGRSSITGHTAKVWDREFAFRGPLQPDPCPNKNINWVSMPVLETKSRGKQWMAKLESFQIWDQHCGSELTTKT